MDFYFRTLQKYIEFLFETIKLFRISYKRDGRLIITINQHYKKMLRDGYEKQNLLFFSTINEIYIEGSHKTGDSIEKKIRQVFWNRFYESEVQSWHLRKRPESKDTWAEIRIPMNPESRQKINKMIFLNYFKAIFFYMAKISKIGIVSWPVKTVSADDFSFTSLRLLNNISIIGTCYALSLNIVFLWKISSLWYRDIYLNALSFTRRSEI